MLPKGGLSYSLAGKQKSNGDTQPGLAHEAASVGLSTCTPYSASSVVLRWEEGQKASFPILSSTGYWMVARAQLFLSTRMWRRGPFLECGAGCRDSILAAESEEVWHPWRVL